MPRLACLILPGLWLFTADVAEAQRKPSPARFDYLAARAQLDHQSYDACLAPDQNVSFTAEWASSGAFLSVTAEGNDPKIEKCLAGILRATRIPAFAGPLTAKVHKLAQRTDCVVIAVRSDKPVPVFVDGVAVGTTPVDYRTKPPKHRYLVSWKTTNGYTLSAYVYRSDAYGEACGRKNVKAESWIDPALMVPATASNGGGA